MWLSDLKPKKKHRFGKQAPKTHAQRIKDDIRRRNREPIYSNHVKENLYIPTEEDSIE